MLDILSLSAWQVVGLVLSLAGLGAFFAQHSLQRQRLGAKESDET